MAATAILVSIRSLANFANVLMELLETVVPRWFSSKLHLDGLSGLDDISRKMIMLGMVLWLPVAIVLFIGSESITSFVLGVKYAQYHQILLISWISIGMYFLVKVFGVRFRTQSITRNELAGSVVGMIAVVTIVTPMMAFWGLYGAAWGYIVIPTAIYLGQRLFVRFAL